MVEGAESDGGEFVAQLGQLGLDDVVRVRLLAALGAGPLPAGVAIRPVECLSACSQGCAVALSAPAMVWL